ncbi:alkylphosphonate utilization protein [Saccharopolyspora spinosa]|uniref:alkylphosphonate utilization protein n=1 Tax=Saccharopolyspora spinosa TaxID=60894 RepID=UPI0023B1F399|nr:alkylphosphonate utilization protein [Saccharopolyspora spinosa]
MSSTDFDCERWLHSASYGRFRLIPGGKVCFSHPNVPAFESTTVWGRPDSGGGTIKSGTKVKGIRLIDDGVGDHDIDATVPGFGRMQLKSSVVKKVG